MTKRILVAEDEHHIRDLVCEVLADEGYDVLGASNGAEALRLFDKGDPPDLVILDMRMPILNGWQFAAALVERGVNVPILVMTAARDAPGWAAEINAIGYIAKPFDIEDFVRSVRRVLPGGEDAPGLLRCSYNAARRLAADAIHGLNGHPAAAGVRGSVATSWAPALRLAVNAHLARPRA